MDPGGFDRLTGREREVLRLVHGGLRSKEIALRLHVSPLTVDDHVKSARRTLGLNSRHAAATALATWESAPPKWGTLTRALPDLDYSAAEPGLAVTLGERQVGFEFVEADPPPVGAMAHELGSYLRELAPAARLLTIAISAMTIVVLTTGMVMILRECGPLLVHLARPLYQLI